MVVNELNTVSGKWENLGKELGISFWTLEEIRTKCSNPADCLKALIRHWLQKDRLLTWSDLVHALKSPTIGESDLGDHLKEKYLPGEL